MGFGRGIRTKDKEEAPPPIDLDAPAVAKRKLKAQRLKTQLERYAPKGEKRSLDAASSWREFSPGKKLPEAPTGTDESHDREAITELRMVQPTEEHREKDGPMGQPHLTNLSSPVYDGLAKNASMGEGEMEPLEIVDAAQLSYSGGSWIDHATLSYLVYAIGLAHAHPQLRTIALRLISRVALSTHQGRRTAASVLLEIQEASAQHASEMQPLLLQYRTELSLRRRLGVIGMGDYAKKQVGMCVPD